MEIFEMASDRLAEIYPTLKCDGCGADLQASPVTVWAKAGCGYYCAA
jgi:hypothetical protein